MANNDMEIETSDSYEIPEDLIFQKASVDPRLVALQKEVTEFVTSTILKHENEFYQLIKKYFGNKIQDLLGSTCKSIISMITETTNKYYNKIYQDIQHQNHNGLTKLVLNMTKYADYGPHILLDKLLRLTLEAHLEVNREKLVVTNDDYSLYEQSVLQQINLYLSSHNLLHILSAGPLDKGEFVNIPTGQQAFDIIIDKNIDV